MTRPSQLLFESLKTMEDVERLIAEGEQEGLYLECKAPAGPAINQGILDKLSISLSSFSNTEGGVLIYGISTVSHPNNGNADVLTDITPIARIKQFSQNIQNKIPTLTVPPITTHECKILKSKPDKTSGIVVIHIPKHNDPPVQCAKEPRFFFRAGDHNEIAPYEMVKRLFAVSESPDLRLNTKDIIPISTSNDYKVSITVENLSSAVAENAVIMVSFPLTQDFTISNHQNFRNISDINPGGTTFSISIQSVVHFGLPIMVGSISVKPLNNHRTLRFNVKIFANRMPVYNQILRATISNKVLHLEHLK